jgi:hypothetical protein
MPLFTFPGQEETALLASLQAGQSGPRGACQARSRGDGTMSGAGRPQKPLPDGPAAAVGAELRRLRERAGLTYRQLADDSEFSLAAVTAACGGRRLPTWQVTSACTRACGGDEDAMRVLYERACAAVGRQAPAPAVTDPPDPAGADTPARFVACMAQLRTWAGNPSLATLNERSGGYLPPSTISGVLRRRSLPRLDLVTRYARACGLPEPAIEDWEKAWKAIKAPERPATDGAAPNRESHSRIQSTAGLARPSPPGNRATPVISLLTILLIPIVNALLMVLLIPVVIALLVFATGASGTPSLVAADPGSAGMPMMVTLQLSGTHYIVQGALNRSDTRALARTIAQAGAETPHQARRTISTNADTQVFVSNLLGAEWGSQHDAYLEALDLEGSGTLSTTALTLGGLPPGTAVGFLSGAGRSLRSCSAARWYIASSMPLIPDSTVCIFRPGKLGPAFLLSIQQRSAQAIALDVNSWYPGSQPGTIQPSASGADLVASSS